MLYGDTERYVKLTREEFYKLVWTTPTVRLARTYGISDVYIAKLCKKHYVPKPPTGYWARRQHGYKVSSKPLPKLSNSELQIVYLPKRPAPEKPIEKLTEVEEKIAFEKSEANRISVIERLQSPHPAVERTLKSLESAKEDERGIVRPKAKGCLDVAVGRNSIDRAMRIMDAFLRALESRGYPVSLLEEAKGRVTLATILNENLAFRLEESVDRKEQPPTAEQKKELARWGRYYPHTYDYSLTGRLTLRLIKGGYEGERKSCSEGETAGLEEKLNRFMIVLINAAQGSKRAREEDEERQRKREEERLLEWEAQKRRWREEERIKELNSKMSDWIESMNIRRFIQAVEQSAMNKGIEIAPESDLSLWLSWARKRADRVDPLLSWSPVYKREW